MNYYKKSPDRVRDPIWGLKVKEGYLNLLMTTRDISPRRIIPQKPNIIFTECLLIIFTL